MCVVFVALQNLKADMTIKDIVRAKAAGALWYLKHKAKKQAASAG